MRYNLLPITAALIILYSVSLILQRRKVVTAATHRKIWNMLLLLSFIGVAASGVILTVRIDYGVNILPRFRTLFWHVETGIAMTVISVFHIIWHLPYFKAIMRARK